MTFVELILRFTKDSEAPRKFYYWSALAGISAVIKNNIWLDQFQNNQKLYPNIFVLLVGKPGIRKGPPVVLISNLVDGVDNTRVFSGRATIQGIINELSKAVTKKSGGPPITDSCGALFALEFASFLVHDKSTFLTLMDLYDGHYNPNWGYTLKNSAMIRLKRPFLTLLGATNEINLKEILPEHAVGGGFLARSCIIFATKKAGINPMTRRIETGVTMEMLQERLITISKLKGEIKWSDAARDAYEAWYIDYQKDTEAIENDSTGIMERLHTHIVKTSVLLSLSRGDDLIISLEDLNEAMIACRDFIPGSKRVALGQIGKSVSSAGTAVLLKELINRDPHEITHEEALRKHWMHFDTFELAKISESLFAQKAIAIKFRRSGNETATVYILNPAVLERLGQSVESDSGKPEAKSKPKDKPKN